MTTVFIPNFVEGLIRYPTFTAFPTQDIPNGKVAIALDTEAMYIWNAGTTTWDLLVSGATANDHVSLTHLAYADAGHTGFQPTIAYTTENVANKDTTATLGTSDTKYPSQKAVKTYVDTSISGFGTPQDISTTASPVFAGVTVGALAGIPFMTAGVMGNTTPEAAMTPQLTTLTFSNPVTPDYAVANLTNTGGFGFASSDEGQTVLSVIANLQTRVSELESKLQSLGLIA